MAGSILDSLLKQDARQTCATKQAYSRLRNTQAHFISQGHRLRFENVESKWEGRDRPDLTRPQGLDWFSGLPVEPNVCPAGPGSTPVTALSSFPTLPPSR